MLWTLHDCVLIAERNLRHAVRTPQFIFIEVLLQPTMFVLIFVYVFGGAIRTPGAHYVDFLLPGILVQTGALGGMNTAVALTEDLRNGLMDRFWSLPMSRLAVVAGRVASDTVLGAAGIAVMLAIGFVIGFRFHGGGAASLAAVGLALLFGFAFGWIGTVLGLVLRTPESVQAASFIIVLPLTFASSVFVPIASMPWWLQAFARHTPMTATVDAVRRQVLGSPNNGEVGLALIWIIAIVIVATATSGVLYRRLAR